MLFKRKNMNIKKLLESNAIEHYLSSKFSAYNVDIYTTNKFIVIEVPHMYSIKKSMEKLMISIQKDDNEIRIVNSKTNYIDSELTIKNKKYMIKMIRSDIDF